MIDKQLYYHPCISKIEIDSWEVICDSYDSGIDDVDYEDFDWSVTP